MKEEELVKIEGINEKMVYEILNKSYRLGLEKIEEKMNKENIEMINIYDEDYPEKLKNIYDKPISIYVKGNRKLLNDFSFGIIGCRENSKYGKIVATTIGKKLALQNITTISGLAKGIDSISQKATIDANGKTIAVIGSGIDYIYPYENIDLANEIVKKDGVIISEYVPGTKPMKMHFPARNRIISGLSNGIIVVEAKIKSGTKTTVDFALEQGKNVFVIPGNITSKNSEGTNELIKQGAKCITCMQDILEEYL